MTNKEFNSVVDSLFTTCKETLTSKSKEYDFGDDRLHSFKAAAVLLKSTPEEALASYWVKHVMSILDMCKCADNFTIDKWHEKIIDSICYMILLNALLIDDRSQMVSEEKH